METGKLHLRMSSEKLGEEEKKEAEALQLLSADANAVLIDEEDAIDAESDPCLRVLMKPPEARTEEELQTVIEATKGVKFFRQMNDPALHLELCRHITHEPAEKDHVVFEQGDEGSVFYIIYSGAVKVMVADPRMERASSLGSQYGSCVAALEDGDSFGELALLGNGLRAATVLTAMSTQLLRVEKVAYETSLHRLHEQELRERMRFLQRIFLFSDWGDEELTRLSKVVTRKRYPKDTCILQQGTNTDNMYLIVSGRCRVLKRMELSGSLHEKLASARGPSLGLNLDDHGGLGSSMSSSQRPHTSAGFSASARGGGLGGSARSLAGSDWGGEASPMLELGEVGVHQYFGERALLDSKNKAKSKRANHTASVVSITPVEVLLLSRYDFYHCIDAKTQQLMVTYAEKFYFDEDKIRRSIQKQHRWDSYKQGLLQEVLSPRASPRATPRASPRAAGGKPRGGGE